MALTFSEYFVKIEVVRHKEIYAGSLQRKILVLLFKIQEKKGGKCICAVLVPNDMLTITIFASQLASLLSVSGALCCFVEQPVWS